MNIGSLFKSMMGDAKPGELKQLDLREGQVVRGVVQSVSDDGKEAVVQIQGVKVNAQLETPLQAGQTAFMQVQPAAEDGSIVMKPVSAPAGNTGAQTIEETLKQVGLPDNKQNRELIRMMQQEDLPVTREQTAEVRNMLAQKPANVSAQEWVRSIGVLAQRGLPVTPQSVAGMQQAIFGPPASALLQNLEQQVAAALAQLGAETGEAETAPGRLPGGTAAPTGGQGAAPASGSPAAANQAAGTASAQAAASAGVPAAGGGSASVPAAGLNGTPGPASAAAGNAAGGEEPVNPARTAGQPAPSAASGSTSAAAPAPQAAGTASAQSAQAQQSTNGGLNADSPDVALLRKVQALLGELRSAVASGTDAAGTAASQSGSAQAAEPEAGPWVGRLLKMLGAEHEQQAARSTLANAAPAAAQQLTGTPQTAAQATQPPSTSAATPPAPQGGAPAPSAAAPATAGNPAAEQAAAKAPDGESRPALSSAVRAAADQALRAIRGDELRPEAATASADGKAPSAPAAPQAAEVRETLKSLLLQLSSSDTLPAAVKDAAQQAVQQLTGQQLLLNTDRTAPFAQVTMFLPFVGPDGNQTASVQIESKRGPKGELDASNCRLWFDLDMKALGRTVIDVQVVDRKVSLNFRNDEEWARPLLEAGQTEIASALNTAGYQLMALRTDALPQRAVEASGEANPSLSYAPQSYRGVDVKI
ncbi:hypothetical protein B9G55_20635 [Saccharibacillus sp. O16]|nr:hypothetical protein B9G55_20635 [Saccharibacillus sp. O16]